MGFSLKFVIYHKFSLNIVSRSPERACKNRVSIQFNHKKNSF
jgi:hypothetical protein